MATTAIGGFMGGVMARQEHDAQIENTRATGQYHAALAAEKMAAIQENQAVSAAMAQAFQGGTAPAPDEVGVSGDPQLARQLDMVGKTLLKTNPKAGLKILEESSQIKQRGVATLREKRLEDKIARERTGSIFTPVTDQATLDQAVQQAKDEGVPLPPGLTGDFATDGPIVQQYAKSFLTEDKQLKNLNQQLLQADRTIDNERAASREARLALEHKEKMDMQQQRLDALIENQRKLDNDRDRDAVLRREKMDGKGKTGKDLPKGRARTIATAAVLESDELEGMPKTLQDNLAGSLSLYVEDLHKQGMDQEDIKSAVEDRIGEMRADGRIYKYNDTIAGISIPGQKWAVRSTPRGEAAKPAAKAPTVEAQVKAAGITYDPTRYEYRILPTGEVQQRRK